MEPTIHSLEQLNFINQFLINLVSINNIIPHDFIWLVLLGIIFCMTLAISFLCRVTINHFILRLVKKTGTVFDETVVNVLRKPLGYFIYFSGLLWALQMVAQYNAKDWDDGLLLSWRLSLIIFFGWFLLSLIKAVESNMIASAHKKNNVDSATVMAVGRLLRLSIMIIMILVIMQNFGFSISGVLAFGGIGGIAIGFAARDLLANFFGGFMIFVDKPFRVGDWICSPDRTIDGTVEDIGWRMTRIRTFDLRPLYVPNSTFMNIAVENPSRMLNRRIYENIGLRYDDLGCIDAVVADIKDMLAHHPDIDMRRTLIVAFDQYANSSLNIMIYTFTKTTDWVTFYEIKQKIFLLIRDIVHKHGADFAFPTQQLYVTQTPPQEDPEPANLNIHPVNQ